MLDVEMFLRAQDNGDPDPYEKALEEIRTGHKRSHWIWYVFPQLASLGKSSKAVMYGLEGIEDARAYLNHPVLRERIEEIACALLELTTDDPHQVMDIWPDSHTDSRKLQSSMTLFSHADGSAESVYNKVLNKFFGGKEDARTLHDLQA